MAEDLRVAEIEDVAPVGADTCFRQVRDDVGEMAIRARVVVVPARARVIPEAAEDPAIVVLRVGIGRRTERSELRSPDRQRDRNESGDEERSAGHSATLPLTRARYRRAPT